MKKYLVILAGIVVVVLLVAGYYWQKNTSEVSVKCLTDTDCKLIYNNCDCMAVGKDDPMNTFGNTKEQCKWNICRGTNVAAVCKNNKCLRSDK